MSSTSQRRVLWATFQAAVVAGPVDLEAFSVILSELILVRTLHCHRRGSRR
jgi:hypothetical protein